MSNHPKYGDYVRTWMTTWANPVAFDPLPTFVPRYHLEELPEEDDDGYEGGPEEN